MTRLAQRKSRLQFETEETARYRGKLRTIIVEADASGFGCAFRLKGTRVRYAASWQGLFDHAARRFAEQQRSERQAARKARKATK